MPIKAIYGVFVKYSKMLLRRILKNGTMRILAQGRRRKRGARAGNRGEESRGGRRALSAAPRRQCSVGGTQGEQEATTAALMGGMMWEAGDGRLLADERSGRGKVMFVTHIWVRTAERRKRWATEAIVREGKRIGAKEIHLIAIDGEAKTAYERMGMKAATSEQVDKEHVAWRPDARKGEVYTCTATRQTWKAKPRKKGARSVNWQDDKCGGRRSAHR